MFRPIGQTTKCRAHIKRAQEIEGTLSLSVNTDAGEIYCWARRYDNAIEELNKVIQIDPNFALVRNILSITYIQKGQINEAIAELELARRLDGSPRILSSLGYAYGISGQHDKAKMIINELKELSKHRYISSFSQAIVYAGMGDEDEAVKLLEMAFNEHSDTMTILKNYPLLERLRDNRRFLILQQRVGLTQ